MKLALVLAIAACTTPTDSPVSTDVVGPFPGAVHRYVVDSITLPTNNAYAKALGDDLNGDGVVDNKLGEAIATLFDVGDVTPYVSDMIASHVLTSSLSIQTDDLMDAAKVGVQYFGADGDIAVAVGGTLVDGLFISNRTRSTSVPGSATIALPAFANADPARVELDAMEIDLTPDPTGYIATIRGGIDPTAILDAAWLGIQQMVASKPASYVGLVGYYLDSNQDGVITRTEFDSSIFSSLLHPDVKLFGHPLVSFGFAVHLVLCDAGTCTAAPPANTCFDRVLDGDETAIDCGGSCQPCPGGAACTIASDCQSNACDLHGCRASTCSDGVQDGFEQSVDCGYGCPCK